LYGAITGVSITKPVLVREISKRKGRARHFRFFICFSNETDVQARKAASAHNINFRKKSFVKNYKEEVEGKAYLK
jgi:hypothetical protein